VAIGIQHYVAMLNSVTGMDFSEQEIRQIGERIITLQRLFLQREIGIKRKDDTFPKIVFEEKLEDNPPYTRAEFEKMLDEYYMERNWDILKGLPTKESVERLSLVEEWERVFSPTA
jgi:aldehyde:ferredoxin oxidoreductase